ncbi:MAG TPA: MFS transporter [Acidimicrobiia bacterium]|nr:MFS transporter [Acidimicrobiia bacterium]
MAVVDVTPLRLVPGFRWLYFGFFFVQGGRQLTVVAVPFQVYDLTGSTLAVGLLGLAQLVPLLLLSLLGGAMADAIDRRKILVFSPLVLALTSAGLMWNALADQPLLWPLFVLSAVNAGISAIDSPARQAMVPGLVGKDLLPSALALNQTLTNTAKAGFPALGGLLIATAGLPVTYAIETACFLVGALLMRGIPSVKIEGGGRRLEMSSIIEGFRYLKGVRIIQAALLLDLSAMVFGMPTALFPAMGTEVFGGDAFTVGLLYAAPGVGALLAALTSGWVTSVVYQGRAVILAVMGWGIAIAVFGFSGSLTLGLIMLALAGAADVVSAIFRGTIIQLRTPDELRGRVSSMHMAVVAGGPRLGDLEAGVVAALTSVRFSVVSGGLACVLSAAVIARWAPDFLRYRSGEPLS